VRDQLLASGRAKHASGAWWALLQPAFRQRGKHDTPVDGGFCHGTLGALELRERSPGPRRGCWHGARSHVDATAAHAAAMRGDGSEQRERSPKRQSPWCDRLGGGCDVMTRFIGPRAAGAAMFPGPAAHAPVISLLRAAAPALDAACDGRDGRNGSGGSWSRGFAFLLFFSGRAANGDGPWPSKCPIASNAVRPGHRAAIHTVQQQRDRRQGMSGISNGPCSQRRGCGEKQLHAASGDRGR